MLVPGKCKNFEKCGSTEWKDPNSDLCRQCEIDDKRWGHNDTTAEDGKQIAEDDGLIGR